MAVLFSPANPVVKLCMMAMKSEAEGQIEHAQKTLQEAIHEATNDFERFIAKYQYSRLMPTADEQLRYLKEALEHALRVDDENVWRAYPTIYENIAELYKQKGDLVNYEKFQERANQSRSVPKDRGPFYHGTKADLKVGDYLNPGGTSNYQEDLQMNHIYFTAGIAGAGLAAALAKGEAEERIYVVTPTGDFEDDPNVTDKKFPGNLTRSYRSLSPLLIVGEVSEWMKLTESEKQKWLKDIEKGQGEIIN